MLVAIAIVEEIQGLERIGRFWVFFNFDKENSEAQNLHNFYVILCNPWISSAMTMAMSIYRTLCVLVFPENFTPRDAHCCWQWASEGNFSFSVSAAFFSPQNFTPRDAHCFWQWASKKETWARTLPYNALGPFSSPAYPPSFLVCESHNLPKVSLLSPRLMDQQIVISTFYHPSLPNVQ